MSVFVRLLFTGAVVWMLGSGSTSYAAPPMATAQQLEFFEKKIRPLFVQHCMECHGANEKKIRGGLRMDSRQALLEGGDTGPALEVGQPEKSLLIEVVEYQTENKMPPKGKISDREIADLKQWIRDGAHWPGAVASVAKPTGPNAPLFRDDQRNFWAFQPMKSVPAPQVSQPQWVRNPIDAFILAKLDAAKLAPRGEADKRTLIRRVTYDLTGLPPTPEEIGAFLNDASPNAYEKVIDRLLASPAYGERWARHWLDVARYADSNGLDENTAFANAFRYRDYVVDSLNADKPYDEFIREQIAGDLLPASTDSKVQNDRLRALGFLVLGPKVLAEPDKVKMAMDIVDEQIETTSKAILGLTISCARCHDHKFDPIPTRDYYGLAGIFRSTRTMVNLNTVARAYERPLTTAEMAEQIASIQKQIREKQSERDAISKQLIESMRQQIRQNVGAYLLATADLSEQPGGGVAMLRDFVRGKPPQIPGLILREAESGRPIRANINRDTYGKGIGILESAGLTECFTEFQLNIPTASPYRLEIRYASAESRPVDVLLDDKMVLPKVASEPTGGFNPEHQHWYVVGTLSLSAGQHRLRIRQTEGLSLPHLDKIALIPVQPKPTAAGERKRNRLLDDLAAERKLNPEVLTNVASVLNGMSAETVTPFWKAWLVYRSIPDTDFAVRAAELHAKWQANPTQSPIPQWHPLVAAKLTQPPKSLAEVAEIYATLLRDSLRSKDEESKPIRQILADGKGPFRLPAKPDDFFPPDDRAKVLKISAEIDKLQTSMPQPAMTLAVEEQRPEEVGDVKVHIRGNHLTLGENAPRIFPRIIAGEQQSPVAAGRSGRLELAQWLTRPDHPLTARVMVNRIWQHHFGEGIVRSPDNFGLLGDRPSHPELLDYLALEFVKSGWSIKAMHRLMLTSNAYRQSTAYDAAAALADPDNRLLWRMNRQRLEAEALRDAMLAISGNLDRKLGGSLMTDDNFAYVTNDQSNNRARYDAPRRSLYLPVIRNAVFDFFQVFDFVEPSVMNGKRASTVVAPQSLFLMNSPFALEQSERVAQQLLAKPIDDAERIREAYRMMFAREATDAEIAKCRGYLDSYAASLVSQESDAAKRRQRAWASLSQIWFASNEFIYLN
ncbi:DUF1553 domain-containing protein [Tuwongella immobilis]|uniref:Cytochrome c domain-containing protein n=1 Tax=Tuwongella immobilis TaxID=692036 RepID=A0A6C2YPB2_9BACT|nr:DUF1553 domain-containing protein [Tuwongella immobilis]VIP02875.1 secreted protein containing duf1549 : Uncharacterized protein OS=Planctomyces maris DSM 8797 GN=PM8797T_15908 PE=4 SV=1: PSCyt1: PSCyt2: PSD1 [Tuwongella immobilis]VTS02713.1 secreted protein containing duf1549 : Uncharacterized protein OS=Planctomyces maris DSM 8797 GN=PM8797T_15908 PE=4 SV=1: PSCyt1: PSCyt2: PSD1 [Tuwongella immobilis]